MRSCTGDASVYKKCLIQPAGQIELVLITRGAAAKVGGKKVLTGKNDIKTEISNQCGRLISNVIVYYNSAILSYLLERLDAEDNARGIEALTREYHQWLDNTFY